MRNTIIVSLLVSTLAASAANPQSKITLDSQTPSKEYRLELPQASTPLVRAYLYQNGVAWASDGTWTPLLRYGTNWYTSASWVQIAGTMSSNAVYSDFQIAAGDIPQAGDYLSAIILTNSTAKVMFGQGRLSVVKTPFTSSGTIISMMTEIDWTTITNVNAPWVPLPSGTLSTNDVLTWDGSAWIAESVGAITGDDLGDHTATENLDMANYEITNAAAITLAGDRKTAWPQGTTNIASASVTGLLSSVDFNTFAGKADTSITNGFATEGFVTGQGYVTETITNSLASVSFVTGQGYVTESVTNGLATEGFVTGQGYVTQTVTNGLAAESFVTGQGYVTQSVTNGLASVSFVTGQGYVTTAQATNIAQNVVDAGGYQTGTQVSNTVDAILLDTPGVTFQSGLVCYLSMPMWFGHEIGVGSTTNNAMVPTGKTHSDVVGDWPSYSWYTSEPTVQDRYIHGYMEIPSWATSWSSSTAMVIKVMASSTNQYCNLNMYSSADLAITFQTNDLRTVFGPNLVNYYYITTNQLPSVFQNFSQAFWTSPDSQRRIRLRADGFVVSSNYMAFPEIFLNLKGN